MENKVLYYRGSHICLPHSFEDLDPLAADIPSVLWARGHWRRVVQLNKDVLIKFGDCDHREEILAMQFAGKHGIPVPEVLAYPGNLDRPWEPFSVERVVNLNLMDGVWYFCMTEMKGVALETVIDHLPIETLQRIATDLRAVLTTLRGIRSDLVASVTSQPLSTMTLPPNAQPQKLLPFADFRVHLNSMLVACGTTSEWRTDLLQHIPSQGQVVFTHGDLLPKNILVDPEDDYHVSAILDWENSGFYPDFWEYCRMNDPLFMTPSWERILGFIFPGERRDKQAEAVRRIIDYVKLRL